MYFLTEITTMIVDDTTEKFWAPGIVKYKQYYKTPTIERETFYFWQADWLAIHVCGRYFFYLVFEFIRSLQGLRYFFTTV